MTVRVSAVEFLNSAPLTWGLRAGHHPTDWEVAFDMPSLCARRLVSGEADVGLVPSIEFARSPDLALAAPLCVAARREVTSVLLLCGGRLQDVRHVRLDPASRTSQALTRILLERVLKHAPSYEESPCGAGDLEAHEAALVIGDPALALGHARRTGQTVDLAELWNRETGLPFVFAVWAGTQPACTPQTRRVLEESYAHGRERLGEIVAAFSPRLGLPEATLRTYLTANLHYDVLEEERRALRLFFSLALKEEFPHERLIVPAPAA